MLSPRLMAKIKHIELKTRRLVQNQLVGAYMSAYKGQGITFNSVRPYEFGDDVRSMDWKVTARTGTPHVKTFIEERELTLMLVIDASASVLFGTVEKQKRDFASEIASILAWSATFNHDRVGLLIFSEEVEYYIPPKRGRNHVLHLIQTLLTFQPKHKGTNLQRALQTLNHLKHRGAIVFIMSDFLTESQEFFNQLRMTAIRHEVVALVLSDPLEEGIPDVGIIQLEDAETGAVLWVDTSSSKWRQDFAIQRQTQIETRDTLLQRAQVKRLDLMPHEDYIHALRKFFIQQALKRS